MLVPLGQVAKSQRHVAAFETCKADMAEQIVVAVRHHWHSVVSWLKWLVGDCRGSPMVETIVAMTIFAVVGAAVLGGASTARRTGARIEITAIAESIARNQMENLFSLAYRDPNLSYATSTSAIALPTGFGVTAVTQEQVAGDTNVERVVVTVTHDGEVVLTLETLRTRP